LPATQANAAKCASHPPVSVIGCQRYQCLHHGPCEAGRFLVRRGCLKYLCARFNPGPRFPGPPDQPVPGVPDRPPQPR
jgi:hypothetical protein